jgi:hypothetical protein
MQIQSTQNINSRKQLLVKSYVPNLKATKKEKGDYAVNTKRYEHTILDERTITIWLLQQTGGTWLELHPVV